MKRNLFITLLVLSFVVLLFACEKQLKSIFNGKDLSGWKVDPPETDACWSVSDGLLKVHNIASKKGSTLWTKKRYKNFEMECQFRFGDGTVDSGIFIRNGKEQIQIGISGSLKRDMTASPYIAGKGYPVEAKGVAELLKLHDWNTLKIKAVGANYTTWLNGKQVMTYTSETAVDEGPIGIQLHPGRVMSIDYRDIRLAELP